MDNAYQLRTLLEGFGTYAGEDLAQARPLFVSRAPQRRTVGAVHKETVYGKPARLRASGGATERVPLSALTLADLDRLADPDRNVRLYAAIRERLQANGGKGERAFPAANPLRKPDANGNPSGPVVRAVTLEIDKLSGVPIRGGVAKNDVILRVDVFTKASRFYLVPVYAFHRIGGLPNKAIVANRDEDGWILVDGTFAFLFSLFPNDLVRVVQKGGREVLGYFSSCDRNNGTIDLWSHDRAASVGKGGLYHHVGVRTAVSVQRYCVDVLGTCFRSYTEVRRGLA
jgi:CRISPR-associated endonuclease Csn1